MTQNPASRPALPRFAADPDGLTTYSFGQLGMFGLHRHVDWRGRIDTAAQAVAVRSPPAASPGPETAARPRSQAPPSPAAGGEAATPALASSEALPAGPGDGSGRPAAAPPAVPADLAETGREEASGERLPGPPRAGASSRDARRAGSRSPAGPRLVLSETAGCISILAIGVSLDEPARVHAYRAAQRVLAEHGLRIGDFLADGASLHSTTPSNPGAVNGHRPR